MNERLEGRTAFVTGGGSGIGAATARRLAAEGASVAVADVDAEKARCVAAEVRGTAVPLDVTDAGAVTAAVRELGPIDILVNNAGGDRLAYFIETDEADWDHVIGLNLRSAMACTRAVLPAMYGRGAGAIVNVASEAGRVGSVGGAGYSAAKAGVIGFTKAIARESARHGVRCNAVAPGPTDTPLLHDAAAAYGEAGARIKEGMIAATVMGRAARPEEVASVIAFLASEDASFITGHTIPVSGGLSMW